MILEDSAKTIGSIKEYGQKYYSFVRPISGGNHDDKGPDENLGGRKWSTDYRDPGT